MNAAAQDLAHAQAEAIDVVTAVRCNLTRGDELFENLIGVIGYGADDEVLRSWCRGVQKLLESQ